MHRPIAKDRPWLISVPPDLTCKSHLCTGTKTGEHSSVTSKELRDNTLRDGLVSEEADPTAFSACVTVPVSVL